MSIANEIARLQQAKSDLATSITNKGVTVPAATTIDGYAALVDQIQTGGDSPLPQGAVEIEYLHCTGTQYINTGIKGSSDITIKLKCLHPATSNSRAYGALFGSRIANQNSHYNIYESYNANYRFGNTSSGAWVNSTDRIVIFDNTEAANVMKIFDMTGAVITTLSTTFKTFNNNLDMYLFANNTNGTIGTCTNGYIYSCVFYRNSSVIANFIPVRVGTVGYMYEKVSKTLFGNDGTGDFVLGPDVT